MHDHTFLYRKPLIDNGQVVVLINSDQPDSISITNSVETVSEGYNSNWVLYKDTTGVWDAWERTLGFLLLSFKGTAIEAYNELSRIVEIKKIKVREGQ